MEGFDISQCGALRETTEEVFLSPLSTAIPEAGHGS